MPWAAPRHCAAGHPSFTGRRCPVCAAAAQARVDAARPTARKRGYDSKWEKARLGFLGSHPTCSCGAVATVVDHIVPHKGDKKLFWDRSNWQPLCASCHNRKTATEDGGFGRPARGDRKFDPPAAGPAPQSCAQTSGKWDFWG
ncbi:HNH endonuclease signature motif containing protein [Pseudogemmobacter bohemicus]|uniref:HNH endonuclease signature motif containing protein n=1 Tax=Pseudogemmobacter bohemicus TaxID=2250708 RepID=UPI000DD34035